MKMQLIIWKYFLIGLIKDFKSLLRKISTIFTFRKRFSFAFDSTIRYFWGDLTAKSLDSLTTTQISTTKKIFWQNFFK